MIKKALFLTGFLSLFLAFAIISPSAFAKGGHCNFDLQNMYVGPFKACQMPASPDECISIGNTDKNKNATHDSGDCAIDDTVVGICETETMQIVYYEGESSTLEIGCSFQGGEWKE